jgi:hypothetical protein
MFLTAVIPELASIDAVVAIEGAYSQLRVCGCLLESVDTEIVWLSFLAWPGGWSFSHDGSKRSRIGAARFVELWHPLGPAAAGREVAAIAGPFARPTVRGEYILIASAGSVLPDMSFDADLTAVDLSALAGESVPVFEGCERLTFVRLPAALRVIPAKMFTGCIRLVAMDLISCQDLTSIGEHAFCGCFSLDRMILPKDVKKIGSWAFHGSGLKSITADGASLEIGKAAFVGCTSLAGTSFGPAKLGRVVFGGCYRLSVLTIQRIDACDPFALCGSNVSSVKGNCNQSAIGTLFAVLTPPSAESCDAEWDAVQRVGIVPMTRLTVRSGPCMIGEAHRRMLSEVDMLALEDLPEGATFSGCLFLRRIQLPLKLTAIPAKMFKFCQHLTETNIGDCVALREVGKYAFQHCWALRELPIPGQCQVIRVEHCGVRALELANGI